MTRRRANTRMGMLGLLMLAIALCMAVLGLLAAVTANSERVLAERHAEAVSADAVSETGAQELLGELDSWLARARANGVTAAQLPAALESDLTSLIGFPWSTSWWPPRSDFLAGYYAQIRMLTADELTAAAAADPQASPRCGMLASFLEDGFSGGADRRTLDVTIVIYDDYTYGLTDWKTTTEWLENATDMKLWEG